MKRKELEWGYELQRPRRVKNQVVKVLSSPRQEGVQRPLDVRGIKKKKQRRGKRGSDASDDHPHQPGGGRKCCGKNRGTTATKKRKCKRDIGGEEGRGFRCRIDVKEEGRPSPLFELIVWGEKWGTYPVLTAMK